MNLSKSNYFCCTLFISSVVMFALLTGRAYSQNDTISDLKSSHFQVNQKNSNSFYWYGSNTNKFRLTSATPGETICIWYANLFSGYAITDGQIDAAKDFIVEYIAHFGDGVHPDSAITDGIVLIFSTDPITDSLLGGDARFIGFGTEAQFDGQTFSTFGNIKNAMGVELDTDFTFENCSTPGLSFEGDAGRNSSNIRTHCHTAYVLPNYFTLDYNLSVMYAISDHKLETTYKPILPGYADVRNDSVCVTVLWQRSNGVNGDAGYDLITYIKNGDSLVEKNNMHFQTLGETTFRPDETFCFGFIRGLSINPTTKKAPIIFGFSSATSQNGNQHDITIKQVINGTDINTPAKLAFRTKQVIIGGEGETVPYDNFLIGGGKINAK